MKQKVAKTFLKNAIGLLLIETRYSLDMLLKIISKPTINVSIIERPWWLRVLCLNSNSEFFINVETMTTVANPSTRFLFNRKKSYLDFFPLFWIFLPKFLQLFFRQQPLQPFLQRM